MTQSTILFTTLAIMLGLGVGYWLAYVFDSRRAIRFIITYTASRMDDLHEQSLDLAAMIKDGRAYGP